jgi:hypothetical protein
MNNQFLQEFLKRKNAREKSTKQATPTTTPLPGPVINSVRGFAASKPTAKQVETFFRERIEKLNRKTEAEDIEAD